MKISIVTISFNQDKYLRQCIDSILSQTDCDLEYIVVDPGSTDNSRQIIESYGDRIIKVFEPDKGPADGLIKGFKHATGDVFGFINSDDYLLPGALAHVNRFFETQGLDCFMTGQGFRENEQKTQTRIRPEQLSVRDLLYRATVVFQQTTFFPAYLYKEIGGFNPNNSTCWDYELFLDLLLQGAKHHITAEDLAVFRLYQGSISGSGRLTQQCFKDLDAMFYHAKARAWNNFDDLCSLYLRMWRKLRRLTHDRMD